MITATSSRAAIIPITIGADVGFNPGIRPSTEAPDPNSGGTNGRRIRLGEPRSAKINPHRQPTHSIYER